MIAFFDTDSLQGSSLHLKSVDVQVVWQHVQEGSLRVYTSEIVVGELIKHYNIELRKSVRIAENSLRVLNGFSDTSSRIDRNDKRWTEIEDIYERRLRGKFSNDNGGIIPVLVPKHEDVLQRVLGKRRPFAGGTDGYKDYIIWISLLQVLEKHPNQKVIFVTNNTGDFALKQEETFLIHPDFAGDLKRLGGPGRIILIQKLEELVELLNAAKIQAQEEERLFRLYETEIVDQNWARYDITSMIEEYVLEEMSDASYLWNAFPKWRYQGLLAIDEVDQAKTVNIESAKLSQTPGGFHLSIHARFSITMLVEAESDTFIGEMLPDEDRDWESRFVMRGRLELPVTAVVSVLLDHQWAVVSGSASDIEEGEALY